MNVKRLHGWAPASKWVEAERVGGVRAVPCVYRAQWLYVLLVALGISACDGSTGGVLPQDDVLEDSTDTSDATDPGDVHDVDDVDADDVDADDVDADDVDADDVDVIPPPGDPPREVRGLRARWTEDRDVALHFLAREEAESYRVCWTHDGVEPQCEDVASPSVVVGVESASVDWEFTVTAIREGQEGPVVERHRLPAWEPVRAVPVWIEMEPEDLAELYARDVRSDEQLPANLRVGGPDGPEVDLQGLRFRGSASREYPRKGFNIRLDDRPELDAWPFFNFRSSDRRAGNRLLLNATWTDPSAMRPSLSFRMYKELGLPAPDTFIADLYLNGVLEGIYVGVERIDREALRGWGLNRREGGFSLFRDQAKDFRPLPEVTGRSIFAFSPSGLGSTDEERVSFLQQIVDYRGEIEDHDWPALLELANWVHNTQPGDAWVAGLEERVDVEAFLDVLALHAIQDDRDSLDVDYWLYRDEDAGGRWLVLPWDKNLTFGAHWFEPFRGANDFLEYDGAFLDTQGNRLVGRTLQTPALRARLDARIDELLRTVFHAAWADETLRALEAGVRPSMEQTYEPSFVMQPAQHHGEAGWFPWHVEALFEGFLLRRAWLLHQVGGAGEVEDSAVDRFRGEVVFDETGRAWVQDSTGWVMATFHGGEPGTALHVEVVVQPNEDGGSAIGRTYEVTLLQGGTHAGTLTFYYRNAPPAHWFSEVRDPQTLWGLTVMDVERDERLPTRVQPFVHALTVEVAMEGTRRFTVVDEGG